MSKDYSVQGTTKLQREKYAQEALGLSTLDAPPPSKMAMALVQEYIDGQCELEDVRIRIIEHYRAAAVNA